MERGKSLHPSPTRLLRAAAAHLHEESCSLWLPSSVRSYDTLPDALTFLRDHVHPSMPCVWRGACRDWPATQCWSRDSFADLRQKVGDKPLKVTITPNGYADSIVETCNTSDSKVFAQPSVQLHTISEVLQACSEKTLLAHGIPYYSEQNSNLTTDAPQLLEDVSQLPFVREAFDFNSASSENGAHFDAAAVNIWVGDERSVTSMHADPFENIYAVVKGCKSFVLRPPSDAAILPKPHLQRAVWTYDSNHVQAENGENEEKKGFDSKSFHPGWHLQKVDGKTAWVDEEAIPEAMQNSVRVDVFEGDILYLPSLWCT